MLRCSQISSLVLIYRGRQVLTERLHLWTWPFVGIQLIGLIPYEANIHNVGRGLDHINVPHGHSCRPAQLKDHAREGLSSSGLKGPLMYHHLQEQHEIHLEPRDHGSHQHCMIPSDNVISSSRGKVVLHQ